MKNPAAPHDPVEVLAAGRKVLDAILLPAGFACALARPGPPAAALSRELPTSPGNDASISASAGSLAW